MKTINIIIDTLVSGQISQYVADTLKLKYIDLHSLLPQQLINNNDLLKKFNLGLGVDTSIVEKIISQEIETNLNENLLIPLDFWIFNYPENLTAWEHLLLLLNRHNLALTRIWYIRNSDVHKTVEESMIMQGYKKPFNEEIYSTAVSRTIDIQNKVSDFLKKINRPDLILTLETDTMKFISTEIISVVKEVAQQS
jgi:hypothetical protein